MSRFCGRMMVTGLCLVLWVFMGMTITGCNTLPKNQIVSDGADKSDTDSIAFEEGLLAFQKGEYEKAMGIFELLSENSKSEDVNRRALYALACTRLILAQTQDEYSEAMSLWDCWSQRAKKVPGIEDPRMITPFLVRMSLPVTVESSGSEKKEAQERIVYRNHLVYRDVVVYKNLLQAKEKEIEQLRSRLESRERDVRRLRHQIESLEAIHLKIQEKKKEISSP